MDGTRERILVGLIKTMAQGVASLSIPAVARESGVPIPTIYRHFRTKQELIDALGTHIARKIGADPSALPKSPEELATAVREMHIRAEGLDDTFRAAALSEMGKDLRAQSIPYRQRMIEDALTSVTKHLDERDRVRLCNIILILSSSAMIRAFMDYLNLSGEEAADNVTWAILTLANAVKQLSEGTTGNIE